VSGNDCFIEVALRDGRATVITDQIDAFTETGIQLKSAEHLDAQPKLYIRTPAGSILVSTLDIGLT
jgi:cation diffusion facilitator CzcD-associated flavoprotein CzcO